MDSKDITGREANEILKGWERLSLAVCFAVGVGELAWHAQWVGPIRHKGPNQWVLVAGQTTNVLSTDQYKQITLAEDDDLVGVRFREAEGAIPGFEVDLFIDKNDHLDEESLPLLSKIVQ